MSDRVLVLLVVMGVGLGLWLISHAVEALRPVPRAPDSLRWAPEIPIDYLAVAATDFVTSRPGEARTSSFSTPSARSSICSRRSLCLVWGDKDWARSSEREDDRRLLTGAETETVNNGGHFLPLDCPHELTELIVRFAAR
jgi:pimeloyl-ACP methyl ester carboxylesterase